MGGNAIKPLAVSLGRDTLRLSRLEVNEIESRIQNSLGLSLLQPKSFPTKNDFGDLDLLGNFSARSPANVQIQIGAVGFVKNGAVTSYAIPVGN